MSLPPVRRSIVVELEPPAAFDLFIRRLPEWWPLSTRSLGLEQAASCHVEAHVGGRLYERSRAGEVSAWGTFLALEEPRRAVFTWHPGSPEEQSTEVEVTFTAQGESTRVDLEHRNWERLGERASFVRELFSGGWISVLERFRALAAGASELPKVEGPGCIGAVPPPPGDTPRGD